MSAHVHHRLISQDAAGEEGELVGVCLRHGCGDRVRAYTTDVERLYGGKSRAELNRARANAQLCGACGVPGHKRQTCKAVVR